MKKTGKDTIRPSKLGTLAGHARIRAEKHR